MANTFNSHSRFAAWLLAAFFLLTQAAALAHEYDHALHKHDAPCAQHFFAGGLDTTAAAALLPVATPVVAVALTFIPTLDLPVSPAAPYAVRAPPRSA